MKKKKILLVDDHEMLMDGMARLLMNSEHFEVAGKAVSGKEAMEKLRKNEYDILITDYEMADFTGAELIKSARTLQPHIKTIVLSMHDDPVIIRELILNGADGYVVKSEPYEQLYEGLLRIVHGKRYFNEEIYRSIIQQMGTEQAHSGLSLRETEILKLIASEYSTKQIAEILNISTRTVETHRKNILRKTGCTNLVGLIKYAYRHNLAG